MRKIEVAIVVSILFSPSLFAQNIRSAVSLSGVDTASCTVPDPCRTFDVAISRTNPGGEVIVLSSAGYGPFTVNKSVSIISPSAYHAAIAPTAGDAITVNVDNAVVVLRGLTLNGLGGANGITFTGSATASNTRLYVANCVISGFSNNGLNLARNGIFFVSELIARENGTAILVDSSPGPLSRASIDHALMEGNLVGIDAQNDVKAVVSDASISGNSSYGVRVQSTLDTAADVTLDNCIISGNGVGVFATNPDINNRAVVRLYGNVISYNIGAGVQTSAAIAYTYGNNALSANNPDVSGGLTPLAQQ